MATNTHYAFRDLWRGPTLLSFARLPLGLAFVFLVEDPVWPWVILWASALTDILDGPYARRTGQVTKTGALVDAMMDKVFVGAVVLALLLSDRLSLIGLLALGTREIGELLIAIWVITMRRTRVAASHRAQAFGKMTTLLQFLAAGNALVRTPMTTALLALTAVAGVLAALDYWREESSHDAYEFARE